MCFHLFFSSSIFFFSILHFSKYRSFISLVRFIPRYFILFEAIMNGIISLISLSDSSLLVYKHPSDFWIFIFHPDTLLNLFISSRVSWWNHWDFLCTVSCHLQITTVLLLPFQFRCLYFFLSDCCG